ncbi:MAG: hypothetical protein A2W23_00040 [Planctomycetes bacterium RBG_16_43_13]|nr:MAG: hypothetical protein A2W23_00040 [Planctomycetes bacterium RBG_16_43_13]
MTPEKLEEYLKEILSTLKDIKESLNALQNQESTSWKKSEEVSPPATDTPYPYPAGDDVSPTVITPKKALRKAYSIANCSHLVHQLPEKRIAEWYQLRAYPHIVEKHSRSRYKMAPCPPPEPQLSIEGRFAQVQQYSISFALEVPRIVAPLAEVGPPQPMIRDGVLNGDKKVIPTKDLTSFGLLIEILADRGAYKVYVPEGVANDHLRVGIRYMFSYKEAVSPYRLRALTGTLAIVETVPRDRGVTANPPAKPAIVGRDGVGVVGAAEPYVECVSLQDKNTCDVMNKFMLDFKSIPPNDESGRGPISFADIKYGTLIIQSHACICLQPFPIHPPEARRGILVSAGSNTIDIRFKEDGTTEVVM